MNPKGIGKGSGATDEMRVPGPSSGVPAPVPGPLLNLGARMLRAAWVNSNGKVPFVCDKLVKFTPQALKLAPKFALEVSPLQMSGELRRRISGVE